MSGGFVWKRSLAGAVALLATAALVMPAGAQVPPPPGGTEDAPLPLQPEGAPPGGPLAGEALPPPILPAPEIPIDDPVVELPPVGQPPAPVVGQTAPAPGLPPNAAGTPFSFADLAEGLLDSVVYISTSQRVTISRNTPVPQGPTPPTDDFFEDFFEGTPVDQAATRGRFSRSAPASSSILPA
jgi:hypothetical protein